VLLSTKEWITTTTTIVIARHFHEASRRHPCNCLMTFVLVPLSFGPLSVSFPVESMPSVCIWSATRETTYCTVQRPRYHLKAGNDSKADSSHIQIKKARKAPILSLIGSFKTLTKS